MDLETITLKADKFPVGLFSDLHADLDSLEKLLAEEPGVKRWFCVGDFIDFRSFKDINDATLERCQTLSISGVRGNHDNNAMALQGKVSGSAIEFLMSLPDALVLECPFGKVGCFHAAPESDTAYCSPEKIGDYLPIFQHLDLSCVFLGHTHNQYETEISGIRIFNLGHMGRNVFGGSQQTYATLGLDGRVEFNRLSAVKTGEK